MRVRLKLMRAPLKTLQLERGEVDEILAKREFTSLRGKQHEFSVKWEGLEYEDVRGRDVTICGQSRRVPGVEVYEDVDYTVGENVTSLACYRAVICGMDPVCCQSSSWMETAHVEKLSRGSSQPFYQFMVFPVLVDVHADPNLLVAYVAEENLLAPEKPDMVSRNMFDHPYASFLFYGMDAAGDFIPIKQLREKFNRPRHEVPTDSEDEGTGEDA
ncbi:clp protease adapter protein ClpF, chloroplastic-like [Malania oleifera]|uniref:clp protease adapter protein ClpF, chloroplastic-like n=1 Tax=Malania oleifera TaxID=397392 RepID=UPI0025AE42A5|nr:clp protease adapter protein ClpF, chloroplastic-like [Malania oleifera]